MIALVLEICGGVFALSMVGFLGLAWVAKLRPDLDEPEADLEKIFLANDQLTEHGWVEIDPADAVAHDVVVRFVSTTRHKKKKISRPRTRPLIHQHRLI